MRIVIVSALLDPRFGGPPVVVQRHVAALADSEVVVLGLNWPQSATEGKVYGAPQLFSPAWPRRWFRGRGLTKALAELTAGADVVHAHMLWDHPVWAAWRACRQHGKPLVITSHGSLAAPWRYRAPHKRLYRSLLLDRILADTACLHVLNESEARASREAGVSCPVGIVANAVTDADMEGGAPEEALRQWPDLAGYRLLVFVGRLGKEKGLHRLLNAWSQAPHRSGWRLVLAGPDYRDNRRTLEAQAARLGIAGEVAFLGHVDPPLRRSLFAAAEAFVLPSESEGQSMALLEAAAAGLPCLFTDACNQPELAIAGGGREVTVDRLVAGLSDLLQTDPEGLRYMGHCARRYVEAHHTIRHLHDGLMVVYRRAITPSETQPLC